ncbi:MAG: TonB-dependent receptor [Hyphomonadaceae bacterium]|nr:TonB-dependent receptor [Hyphomonadaceae bacterium]
MINLKKLAGGVAFVAVTASLTPAAYAQVTTSGVQGTVSTADGAAAGDATVTVEDTRTGLTRTVVTTPTGAFDVRGLNVGGPYTVSISASGQQTTQVNDVFLALGQPTSLSLTFSGSQSTDIVIITATQAGATPIATGPAATFSLADIENAPLANRDIRDLLASDPRISIDQGNSDALSCGGANPRYNALTLDGTRIGDSFGLNSSGYPTERMPFSLDAIEQVSVELAPFDVQYGFFTACNINAVTKSGSNEFHGGVFFDYTDDGLTGDKTDGVQRNLGTFDEKRYGASLGGPIIPDTLFFFAAYEKFEGANVFAFTPQDKFIDPAVYQAVIDTAVNQYGYEAGGLPGSIAVEDEKLLVKLDWNINDRHRASLTYNYNDGFNFSSSDDTSTQIVDGNHYYERGAKLESYTGQLFSDWTDNFSTEFRVSNLKLDNRQNSVAGPDFGEIQVDVPRTIGGTARIYLGSDDSRHRNKLSYEVMSYKAAMNYAIEDHLFTAGVEREELDVFNLFLQEVEGEWRFSSLANFQAGRFSYFEYSNSVGTNDPNDSAAAFGFETTTMYLQDDWQVNDVLNIVAGLRLDVYSSDDKPAYNAAFRTRYGFSNDETFDGLHLLQPRIGFTYDFSDDITFRGGAGLYSGGNPNVWLSNSYSNTGVLSSDFICQNAASSAPTVRRCSFPGLTLANPLQPNLSDFTYNGSGRPFYDVPTQGVNFIGTAAPRGGVNAIDPDFELPASWRYALGATWNLDTGSMLGILGGDYRIDADVLYAQTDNAPVILPLGYVSAGKFIDGRPRYTGNTNDFLLSNSDRKSDNWVYSLSVHKDYDFGLDWTLGYAHVYGNETNPMTSSVAFSNFENAARYDIINMPLDRSDYVVPHRFSFNVNYELELMENFPTKFSLGGYAQEGLPYSYTMATNTSTTGFEPYTNSINRTLAYIPTGVADPFISPSSNAGAVQRLNDYISSNDRLSDYRGQIAPRNIANDDWIARVDFKLSQAIPGFAEGHQAEAFMVIQNIGNLMNPNWGIVREHGFPALASLYTVSGVDSQGRYIISANQTNPDADTINVDASLWQVRFGARYDF